MSQGGSNADNVLVDGYLKGLSTGIDVRLESSSIHSHPFYVRN